MVEEIIVIEEHTEDPNSSKENNVTVIQTQEGFEIKISIRFYLIT